MVSPRRALLVQPESSQTPPAEVLFDGRSVLEHRHLKIRCTHSQSCKNLVKKKSNVNHEKSVQL